MKQSEPDHSLGAQEAFDQVRGVIDKLEQALGRRRRTGVSGILGGMRPFREDILQAQQGLTLLQAALRAQQENHQQLQAVQQVSRAISSSLDLAKVLDMVMDTFIELTGAERGYMMLLDQENDRLDLTVARNMDRETIHQSVFEISRSIVNRVAREGVPIVTTNAQADPRFSTTESVVDYHLRSILCVPLKVRDRLIGVIYADNRAITGLFDDRDRDLLMAFANQAAVAIQNAHLFEQVTTQLEAITSMKNLTDNVFASMVSGVVTTDGEDRITFVNRAAETILGMTAQQLEGRPCAEALPELEVSIDELLDRVKERGRVESVEVSAVLPTRGQVELYLQLAPLKNTQGATLGVAVVLDDHTDKRRREKTMAQVRRYLPPALVDSLPSTEELRLGGVRQRISILFGDVRGFTTYSAQQAPEVVVDAVNRFFTVAADVILRHEGVIDKYMGDAIMALFNTPFVLQADHALRAVRTAWAIMSDLAALRGTLQPEFRLQMGIGVHTGEAVLGNIGSPDRHDFSAVGDAVNLAKRLQEAAGSGQILLSQAVVDETEEWIEVVSLGPLQVKGRPVPEQVYELIGLRVD